MIGRLGRTVAVSALTLAVMCGLWEGAIVAFNLSSFVAKGPVAVFDYLVTVQSAAANRSELLSALWITLRDAAFGYVGGTVVAVAVAVAVVWRKDVAQTVMPVAIALRSVPLVAMVPILTLVLGQGLLSVVVIAGIVTFFPTLVNVAQGPPLGSGNGVRPICCLRCHRLRDPPQSQVALRVAGHLRVGADRRAGSAARGHPGRVALDRARARGSHGDVLLNRELFDALVGGGGHYGRVDPHLQRCERHRAPRCRAARDH